MNDQTARLATPIELSWDNPVYLFNLELETTELTIAPILISDRARLKAGKLNSRTDLFYHYMYEGYMGDEDDLLDGLFHSSLLVNVSRAAAYSVIKTNLIPTRCTGPFS